jgi:hypothetical protein
MRSAIAIEARNRRRWLRALRLCRQRLAWHETALLEAVVAVCADCQQEQQADEHRQRRTVLPWRVLERARLIRLLPDCFATSLERLRLTILPSPELIGELLTNRRTRSISRKCADVHEEFRTAVSRSYKPEPAIIVPRSQDAREWHLRGLDKMAWRNRAVRPLQHRRLRGEGVSSYTNAPDRRSVGLLRICEEADHAEI